MSADIRREDASFAMTGTPPDFDDISADYVYNAAASPVRSPPMGIALAKPREISAARYCRLDITRCRRDRQTLHTRQARFRRF